MEGKKSAYLKPAILFLSIIHCVGIAGLYNDSTKNIFGQLVPFNILLSIAVLFYFHHRWTGRSVTSMIIILLAGFFTELIGVNTGWIFGDYYYGNSLGWKIMHTPVIIGLNWLMLIYIAEVTVRRISPGKLMPFLGAAMLTSMDYFVEGVAIKFDLWHWQNGMVPLQNYVAWFCISLLMLWFFSRMKTVERNELATPLLIIQALFFLILNIL